MCECHEVYFAAIQLMLVYCHASGSISMPLCLDFSARGVANADSYLLCCAHVSDTVWAVGSGGPCFVLSAYLYRIDQPMVLSSSRSGQTPREFLIRMLAQFD